MRETVLLLACALGCAAQTTLRTEMRNGVERADVRHASDGAPVTDDSPAAPGETVIAVASGGCRPAIAIRSRSAWFHSCESIAIVGDQPVPATRVDGGFQFALPDSVAGAFVELSIVSGEERSNAATLPVSQSDPGQLLGTEVDGIVTRAATAIDNPRMAIVVVDRAGRPLAIYRKLQATDAIVEQALSLARTGAFFSHDQAPLSSRTVRTISREHFPNDVPNQPAAALFGIENTNRGCDLNTAYLPGKSLPPAKNALGAGPGLGVATIPGGIPLYKNRIEVGGLGVAGIDPDAAEFAAVAAVAGTPFFVPLPLPEPGAVYIDGIRLPYVNQTTRPAGTTAASGLGGVYQIAPRDGASVPDGYLVVPRASATLTADEVAGIIQRAIDRANATRAMIRLPLGSRTRMAISVTDLDGNILGLYRMPDSTVFSVDVAVAKARNVVYFSGANADSRDLPGVPAGTAVTNRTIGFGAQSFFPSGIDGTPPGPFRDLYLFDLANPCTQGRQPANPNQSGIVFFPGSAPLYRNERLIGGLGVSGDGVEQDDYVTASGAQGFEAPADIRADQIFLRDVRLPYWKFPRNPEQ